jgi:hypothetical protein
VECADLSALWSAATCRGAATGKLDLLKGLGAWPPKTKAVTGNRTRKSVLKQLS